MLRYITPPIWRRVLVTDHWRLGDLHPVFVRVMGWAGYHLHAFRFGGGFKQDEYSTRETVTECGPSICDEDTVILGQVFTYEYDFGDSWLHQVKVEKIMPYDPGRVLSVCLAGARACPPEDCGSFPGYANVLRALAKAETEEDRDLLEWLGPYDPEQFNLAAVNQQIQPQQKAKVR